MRPNSSDWARRWPEDGEPWKLLEFMLALVKFQIQFILKVFLLTKHQNQEGLTTTNLNLQNKNPLELDIHASYRRKAPAIVDAKLLFSATKF